MSVFSVVAILTSACSGKKSSTPSGILGIDQSGVYALTGVSCFNSSDLSTVTDSASISGMTHSLSITGNDYVETISDADCSVEISGKIQFLGTQSYSKSRLSVSVPSTSCAINYLISGGGITPNLIDELFTAGSGLSDEGYWLGIGAQYLGLIEDPHQPKFQLTGKVCYSTYEKQ